MICEYKPMLNGKYKQAMEDRKKAEQFKVINAAREMLLPPGKRGKGARNATAADGEQAPDDHDWMTTPAYHEYVKGKSQAESLMATDLALGLMTKIIAKKEALKARISEIDTQPTQPGQENKSP